jgi:hypothetical protein
MEIYPWQPCLFLPDQARLNKTRFAEDTTQTIHAKAQFQLNQKYLRKLSNCEMLAMIMDKISQTL